MVNIIGAHDCVSEMNLERNSLVGSAIGIVLLPAKHAGATVLTCYSIPTG